MKASAFDDPLLASHLQLATGLSTDSKLDLIAQLSASVKEDLAATRHQDSFAKAFGSFKSTQTAEELIADIRASRTFIRQIESF